MMFTAVPPIMAPQTTGHPAALPQDAARVNPETRVSAPKEGSATENTRSDARSWHANPGPQARDNEENAAPPTLLQIKINSMLEEQQQARAKESREAEPVFTADPEPQIAAAGPSATDHPPGQGRSVTPQAGYFSDPAIEENSSRDVSLTA